MYGRASRRRNLYAFAVFVILASLDNAAAGVLPPLYALIARALDTDESALGLVTAIYILVLAVASTFWGYRGDRGNRKRLLFYGTVIWGTSMVLSGLSSALWQFLLFQMATAAGVGAVSSVGFSVIADMIPAGRRGLALSMWSMAQGGGATLGATLASTIGAIEWRWPFFLVAGLGFIFAALYLTVDEPDRGQTEPELAALFAAGERYSHRIRPSDLISLLRRRSNQWLLFHALAFDLVNGAAFWIPRWAIARMEAQGHSLEIATVLGNLLVLFFSIGSLAAIPAGHLGDRLQRRYPAGRAYLAAAGMLGTVPFFIALYFIPLPEIVIPEEGGLIVAGISVITSLLSDGHMLLALVVALAAMTLFSAVGPNWAAMITDVNLPEHRGTVVGISRLARATGNSVSVALAGWSFVALTNVVEPPLNFSIGLAIFQLAAIPAGLTLWRVGKKFPADRASVRQTMRDRAARAVQAGNTG